MAGRLLYNDMPPTHWSHVVAVTREGGAFREAAHQEAVMSSRNAIFKAAAVASLVLAAPSIASAQSGGGNNQNVGQATVGNLIAALNNIAVEIGELNALNNLSIADVRVVDIDDVLNNNNVQAFNNALNRNNVQVLNLRNVLTNNSCSVVAVCNSLNNVLQNADIAITDVVAINVLSGGDVVVFAR